MTELVRWRPVCRRGRFLAACNRRHTSPHRIQHHLAQTAGRTSRALIEHPSARAYRLGGGLFASIAPYAEGASVSLVDRITDETLSLSWAPAHGFTPVDPTAWLHCRGRARLDAGSAEHTVLRLARLLPDLVSERGPLW